MPAFVPGQQQQPPTILGTDTLGADGTFRFSGHVNHPLLGVLSNNKGQGIYVVIDGSDVEIHGDASDLDNATTSGSPATTAVEGLMKEVIDRYNQISDLEQQVFSAHQANQPVPDETFDRLSALNKSLDEYLTGYVKQSDEPIALMLAAMMMDVGGNYETLKALNQRFEEENFNSIPFNAALSDILADYDKWIGREAPEISMPDRNGEIRNLSDLRGKYVLIDFWAAWCAPCRRENPNVVRLWNKYKNKGFTIFSVSLDNKKENWLEAIRKDGLAWDNHVSELKGWQTSILTAYGVNAIPATFLINPDGKVIGKDLRGYSLEKKLEELFGS